MKVRADVSWMTENSTQIMRKAIHAPKKMQPAVTRRAVPEVK